MRDDERWGMMMTTPLSNRTNRNLLERFVCCFRARYPPHINSLKDPRQKIIPPKNSGLKSYGLDPPTNYWSGLLWSWIAIRSSPRSSHLTPGWLFYTAGEVLKYVTRGFCCPRVKFPALQHEADQHVFSMFSAAKESSQISTSRNKGFQKWDQLPERCGSVSGYQQNHAESLRGSN